MISDQHPLCIPCENYEPDRIRSVLAEALDKTGFWDMVHSGMRIGVKLNLCSARKPETAAVTHPVFAAELAGLLTEHGLHAVFGDSPGEPFTAPIMELIYNTTGMKRVEERGGELNRDFSYSEVKFPAGRSVHSFQYCSWLSKCDAVISFSKLKSHGLMGMTAAVKNLYGVIPGTFKSEYHYLHTDPGDFANMLVDLNEFVRPILCLCDAVEIMEGNGPTQGTPRHLGLLLAGTSPYELDRLAAHLLGIPEKEIPYMTAAKERGLFISAVEDYANAAPEYCLKDFVRSGATSGWFTPAAGDKPLKRLGKKLLYIMLRSSPAPDNTCTGCGHCARGCPAKAIKIKNGRAVIDRKKCVRCFCCQEFCPFGAMKAKRSLVARIAMK